MFTFIIELTVCRPGYSGGLVPELRLGLARLSWCRGSLIERMRAYHAALADAWRGIGA